MNSKAPALATWLLEHLVPGEKAAIAGDLVEEFRNGRSRAWFWRQALTVIFLAFCSESYRQRSAIVFAMLWAGIVSVLWSHSSRLLNFRPSSHGESGVIGLSLWSIPWESFAPLTFCWFGQGS